MNINLISSASTSISTTLTPAPAAAATSAPQQTTTTFGSTSKHQQQQHKVYDAWEDLWLDQQREEEEEAAKQASMPAPAPIPAPAPPAPVVAAAAAAPAARTTAPIITVVASPSVQAVAVRKAPAPVARASPAPAPAPPVTAPPVTAPAPPALASARPTRAKEDEQEDEQEGDTVPAIASFDDMGLKDTLLRGIFSFGFEKPSPIQQRAIVPAQSGRDMYIQAKAGTGKTGAFAVAALQCIDEHRRDLQCIILSPTRELAAQTSAVVTDLAKHMPTVGIQTLMGGTHHGHTQHRGAATHIACGTPGRVLQMLGNGALRTSKLRMLILDEADRLLSDDLGDQMREIFDMLPTDMQILLVSATMPRRLHEQTSTLMRNPIRLIIKPEEVNLANIRQYYVDVGREDRQADARKLATIEDLYEQLSVAQCIIFTNTQRSASALATALRERDHSVSVLTGEMPQDERTAVLAAFKRGETRMLVATNVLARGIDVQQVRLVINFDLPRDMESYVHRIGRCGRWGRRGIAITLACTQGSRDVQMLTNIEKHWNCIVDELPGDFDKDL